MIPPQKRSFLLLTFIAGVLGAHQFNQLPPPSVLNTALWAGLLLLIARQTRWLAVGFLALWWTFWHFDQQLSDQLNPALDRETVQVSGTVTRLPETYPEFTRFRFSPDPDQSVGALPTRLLAYWYQGRSEVRTGQRWLLELQLKVPRGRVNFHGADREKWLFSERIGALATVRSGRLIAASNPWPIVADREHIKDAIAASVNDSRSRGVIQALAIADRSGLASDVRDLLIATGTAHLLAISGLHIGLAALAGTWLGHLLFGMLPAFLGSTWRYSAALLFGLLAAGIYSALAGWGLPTQRSLIMIAVVILALLSARVINPWRSWVVALFLVLLVNPLAPLSAGFWFSFLAVAGLIAFFSPRTPIQGFVRKMLFAQASVLVIMIPLGIGWFQIFSPISFLANLIAIPVVSLIIVPLILAAIVALQFMPPLVPLLLKGAAMSSSVLLDLLQVFSQFQGALGRWPEPATLSLLLALLGGFLMLLPRGIPARWLGLFLIAPVFFPPVRLPPGEVARIDALDAGQGTAVLISTTDHSLLYDSGPGDGAGRDLAGSVIVPAVSQRGSSGPDRIIISHADLDHAGGVRTLAGRYPDTHWLANWPVSPLEPESKNRSGRRPSWERCDPGASWQWDGFEFEILHPGPGLPYLGNDSSCVVSMRGHGFSLLLPGDISASVERRLLSRNLQPHQVIVVPHHGSKTSSSVEFAGRLESELAIATTGAGNRFGFPRPEIRQRYLALDSAFHSTGECGGIRIQIHRNGTITARSARKEQQRIWRWPATDDCP